MGDAYATFEDEVTAAERSVIDVPSFSPCDKAFKRKMTLDSILIPFCSFCTLKACNGVSWPLFTFALEIMALKRAQRARTLN